MNDSGNESDPIFDGDEEFITRGQHWRAHQAVRQRFERLETRLDDQFDDVHNNMLLMNRQMADIQDAINNLAHRRRRHSSSSSSSYTHNSASVDPSSSSTSRDGRGHHHHGHRPHHRRHDRSPRRHDNEDQGHVRRNARSPRRPQHDEAPQGHNRRNATSPSHNGHDEAPQGHNRRREPRNEREEHEQEKENNNNNRNDANGPPPNGPRPNTANDNRRHQAFNNSRLNTPNGNDNEANHSDDEDEPHRRHRYAQPHHHHRRPMNDRDLGPRRVRPNHREQPNDNNNRREPSEASVRLQHRNNQANEEKDPNGLVPNEANHSVLKFQMPKFKGEEDPNAYIDWELKVEKIFRIHNYSEEKKVAMASLEFEYYASV